MSRPSAREALASISGPAREILDRIRASGALAPARYHVVGGAIRDALLGVPARDLDLAVDDDPASVLDALVRPLELTELRVEPRFLTARATVPGVGRVDVARARVERYRHDGALPVVRPADLATDLARRDFTVNAIAARGDGSGPLLDPHGGVEDCARRRLRVLHRRSFRDDPTRIVRGARYAANRRLRIDGALPRLAAEARQCGATARVSAARWSREFHEAFLAAPAGHLVDRLAVLGVWCGSRAAAARVSRRWPEPASLWEAALAAGPGRAGASARRTLVERLAARDRTRALWTLELDRIERILASGPHEWRSSARRTVLRWSDDGGDARAVALLGLLAACEERVERRAWFDRLRRGEFRRGPVVRGSDLVRAGVPSGPSVGRGLAAAREAWARGRAATRAVQLRHALDAVRP